MEREINIADVVKYLNRAFVRASQKAAGNIGAKASRTMNKSGKMVVTSMYNYQVEFCYLMDNITRAPRYISTKKIHEANDLIAKLEAESIK